MHGSPFRTPLVASVLNIVFKSTNFQGTILKNQTFLDRKFFLASNFTVRTPVES